MYDKTAEAHRKSLCKCSDIHDIIVLEGGWREVKMIIMNLKTFESPFCKIIFALPY